MEEADLIGYALGLLDSEEALRIQLKLEQSPKQREAFSILLHWLHGLGLHDLPQDELPDGLRYRTLRAIVAHVTEVNASIDATTVSSAIPSPYDPRSFGESDALPLAPTSHKGITAYDLGRSSWRLVDFVVLAILSLLVASLVPPVLLQAKHWERVLACQNNLRRFHTCLRSYAEQHNYSFPAPEEQGPLARAGAFVLLLRRSGTWDHDLSVICPANRSRAVAESSEPPSLEEWLRWASSQDEAQAREFEQWCRRLSGCYAYHLGYRDEERRLCGLTLQDDGCLPILADRPLRAAEDPHWSAKNSPNHAGLGQNVLCVGGHVKFQRRRFGDYARDDIYLNRERQLAAGCDRYDVVLAPSEASPAGTLLKRLAVNEFAGKSP